ncbi:hypothetical protein FACS1894111_04820 [Clostridia bacterium]|nr:hypothetical protein FACS1894111_04820 [Clostridia bacterium]
MRACLKTDFYRMFRSRFFLLAIVGIAVLYLVESIQVLYTTGSVLDSLVYNSFLSTPIISFSFCTLPFSACFLEDREHNFDFLSIRKGKLQNYVRSKVLVCFCGAVLAMVFGILLYVLLLHFRFPFFVENSLMINTKEAVDFGVLIAPNTILLYFICIAGFSGLLAGIFALLSAYCSLYEKNRLFTICAPLIGFYFLENFLTNGLHLPPLFNIWAIYTSGYSIFGNKAANIAYGIAVAIFAILGIGKLIEKKIERDLYGSKMELRTKKRILQHKDKTV